MKRPGRMSKIWYAFSEMKAMFTSFAMLVGALKMLFARYRHCFTGPGIMC